jgi:hypothetical protein
VSLPSFPTPGIPGGWPSRDTDPGPIPLHPLTTGAVIGTAFGVVRRHFAALAPVALLFGVLSAGAELGVLALAGTLDDFATGAWERDVLGASPSLPASFWIALILSELVSIIGGLVLAGLATAYAGADAMGELVPGSGRRRLGGRIGALVGTSVVVGLATAVGAALFLIPGVLAYLTWMLATPAVVMERADLQGALRRSAGLASGHRARFFGVLVLMLLIGGLLTAIVQVFALNLASSLSDVAAQVLSQGVAALVTAVTGSWLGAVIAVLYIDIRVRREDLGPALRAYAAAQKPHPTGGPALA